MTPRNGGNNEAAAAGRGFAGDQTWVSLLAADLRTQSCFCDALATPTWKQNNVDIRVYFGIKFFRERRIMVKIQVWASRSKGRETRVKYWTKKIANIPTVFGLVSDFQYGDIRSQKYGIKGGSGCLHRYIRKEWENMVVIFSLDTFPRRITNWGQQFIKSHHKMQSSSVLSLCPPSSLVRPSGRAWGEL